MHPEYTSTLTSRLAFALRDRFEARQLLAFWLVSRSGTLPLASYVAHLRAWGDIWAEVEVLGRSDGAHVFTDDLIFSGLLRADCAYLTPLCPDVASECARAAEVLVRQIRTTVKAEAVAFLGVLYALERMLLEARTFDDCGRMAYGLSFSGRSFWRYQVIGAEARIAELGLRLDAIPAGGRAADRIEASARATIAAFLDIERTISSGTDLTALSAHRTPPGALVPPRPNQRTEAPSTGMGIIRGAPNGRRPR